MGFRAGDANLYRYVGNNPTNYVDPTGLAEKPVQSANPITQLATEYLPGGWFGRDFSDDERHELHLATWDAIKRLEKADKMLTDHWDRLKEGMTVKVPLEDPFVANPQLYAIITGTYTKRYRVGGPRGIDGYREYDKTYTYRELYRSRIRKVLDHVRNNPVLFATSNRSTGPAHVKFYVDALGVPIRISPMFFEGSHDGRVGVLRHEFGRWAGFVGADRSNDWKSDVYQWDVAIDSLGKAYDRLSEKTATANE